jgi:peptidoglycan/xylan/chitin deacetylase (PgdA/CDA1 family)
MAPPRAWWLLVALAGICVSASAAPRRRGACASTARAADPAVFLGTAQSQGSSIGADRHGRRGVGGVGPDRYGRRGVASGCHPILMYHVVSAPPPGAAYPQLWVPQRRFAREMAPLRRAGYHAVTLASAWRAWRRGGPLPVRPIVISFDDGYRSDFKQARPVLSRLDWPGNLNLVLANVGPGGITARQVRRLIASGWEIDSHALTHPDLTSLPEAALRRELIDSRAEIWRRFGQPADFFCYPAGRYDARVVAAVRAARCRAAMTEDEGFGVASQRYVLQRVRVNSSDTPASSSHVSAPVVRGRTRGGPADGLAHAEVADTTYPPRGWEHAPLGLIIWRVAHAVGVLSNDRARGSTTIPCEQLVLGLAGEADYGQRCRPRRSLASVASRRRQIGRDLSRCARLRGDRIAGMPPRDRGRGRSGLDGDDAVAHVPEQRVTRVRMRKSLKVRGQRPEPRHAIVCPHAEVVP